MKNIPTGRMRAGWEKEFWQAIQMAACDLGDITEEEILNTVREYRLERKKMLETNIVARPRKKST